MTRWPLSVAALGLSAFGRLLVWLISSPPLPRRITAKAVELVWHQGLAWGATLASFAWLALIVFALIVRKVRP